MTGIWNFVMNSIWWSVQLKYIIDSHLGKKLATAFDVHAHMRTDQITNGLVHAISTVIVHQFHDELCSHVRSTAIFSGTTRVSRYQKGKTNLDFTEARDSEWQWHQLGHMQVCCSRQITMPAPHHSVFYRPDALPAAQPTVSKHWGKCTEGKVHDELHLINIPYLWVRCCWFLLKVYLLLQYWNCLGNAVEN